MSNQTSTHIPNIPRHGLLHTMMPWQVEIEQQSNSCLLSKQYNRHPPPRSKGLF
jgi:hypothetical protein